MVRFALVALLCAGCVQDGLDDQAVLPDLDANYFGCEVEPVLVKSCAMLACHGTPERPFLVYGRGRFRLGPDKPIGDKTPLTEIERQLNFDMARGFVELDGESQLLHKPLESDIGGFFHRGKDQYGSADVFTSKADPDFQALERWVAGASAPAPCGQPL